MSPSVVVVEGLQCLAHAWWIDTLLYLMVCCAVVKYALPLARGLMMCYRIAHSVMDMIALQTAFARAKPVAFSQPALRSSSSEHQSQELPRGVMRRPVVKPMGS